MHTSTQLDIGSLCFSSTTFIMMPLFIKTLDKFWVNEWVSYCHLSSKKLGITCVFAIISLLANYYTLPCCIHPLIPPSTYIYIKIALFCLPISHREVLCIIYFWQFLFSCVLLFLSVFTVLSPILIVLLFLCVGVGGFGYTTTHTPAII